MTAPSDPDRNTWGEVLAPPTRQFRFRIGRATIMVGWERSRDGSIIRTAQPSDAEAARRRLNYFLSSRELDGPSAQLAPRGDPHAQ